MIKNVVFGKKRSVFETSCCCLFCFDVCFCFWSVDIATSAYNEGRQKEGFCNFEGSRHWPPFRERAVQTMYKQFRVMLEMKTHKEHRQRVKYIGQYWKLRASELGISAKLRERCECTVVRLGELLLKAFTYWRSGWIRISRFFQELFSGVLESE